MRKVSLIVFVAFCLVLTVALFATEHPKAGMTATLALLAGMSFATMHNIGAIAKVVRAAANTAVTAGGSGDAAEVTGVIIDRLAHGNAQSCIFAIPYTATLAAGKKLAIAYTIEHGAAATLSDTADFVDVAAATVATGAASTGSTETGCLNIPVDLSGAKRYIRLMFTPDLDATSEDAAALSAVCVLGGSDTLPIA